MDAWGSEAWDQVCELLRAVERIGKWPLQLKGGIVCLLQKGGVGPSVADPLQARPVVLLSVLYRVWAKARSSFLERWIRDAGMQPLEESGASCEDLAVDLAFVLEAAKVAGALPAWAVATDLSKAYDRIPLDVLEEASVAILAQAILAQVGSKPSRCSGLAEVFAAASAMFV
jgi:hypothetical protein